MDYAVVTVPELFGYDELTRIDEEIGRAVSTHAHVIVDMSTFGPGGHHDIAGSIHVHREELTLRAGGKLVVIGNDYVRSWLTDIGFTEIEIVSTLREAVDLCRRA